MKGKALKITAITLVVIGTMALGIVSQARADRQYDVTITNITRGQVFSPPVVITHNHNYNLFTLGAPASAQLYPLAEDGMTDPLTGQLLALDSVYDFAVAEGPVPPGQSITLQVSATGRFKLISALGMLVTTNDAFFSISNMSAPKKGMAIAEAVAYDAGSEANSEDCSFIPGPPCENPGQRDTGDAEGYVHVHAGIQGTGDIMPENADWRNPVALVTIQRASSQ